ncbi:hypothetical protein HNP99_003565 [Flavobacterium sp. 28A]|uniref:hypothetical protein n=1 Tax=Flavobacterium sp. 28A TaxID=2735895 RepID=UPI0015711F07|nr:hypothetical protein [Flavobacterium sp. 28A]NRT17186.1 hypothetical protein [Flavobacterium sp. 28A]
MKNKFKELLKFTILFIFILSLMTNCEQNSLIETNQNSLISHQQSRFKVTVLTNEKIKSNNKIVQKLISIDLKNKKSNSAFSKEIHNKLGFTINTDNVNYMEDTQTGIHSYSFQILRDSIKTSNLENLLIQSNSKGGYDAYIIQYGFTSEEYANLNTKSIKKYKTSIYSVDFDTSTFKNGTFSKMAFGCTETWEWAMIDDGDRGELVGAGNEEPFEAGWVLTGISCGYSDDGTGNSGGQATNLTNTSGGGASAVIAAPNTVPYTSQLKNFESGTLNSVERTYYNRDSDIKNTLGQYLIDQNFSNTAKLDAKLALEFSSKYELNFHQFNWVFNNRDSEELLDIKSYLNEIIFVTPEIESFFKKVIDSEIETNNSTEVDFDYRVIVDKSLKNNPNLYGVYSQLGKAPGFQTYLQKFDNKFLLANLKLSVDNQFGINYPINQNAQAITLTPENYLIKIILNNDASLPSNIMKFPKIISPIIFIHEMMHAEINRILLKCSKLPNVNTQNMTDKQWGIYLKNIQNDFPKLYKYYEQYQLNTTNPTEFQHEYMADRYRNTIKQVLKQYDSNAHSEEFYNTLSWFGLKGTAAWTNLKIEQRDQINNSLLNIYENEPYFN